ncbi:MAG: ABC transporter ATP-binding protein/permease [Holosporales bacterium]|jgi:subfamily B ATP-binding cassette protein MsbA|nr:ABC transporter ATP-binding protein/permease [Holosporales bacterium]
MSRLYGEHIKPNASVLMWAVLGMTIAAGSTGMLTYIIQRVIDDVIVHLRIEKLVKIAAASAVISVMKGIGDFVKDLALANLGQKMVIGFQMQGFRTLVNADLDVFYKNNTGDLVFRLTNDVTTLRNVITTVFTNLGKDFVTLIFLVGLAFYKDFKLALIGFVGFPLILFPILRIGRLVRDFAARSQDDMGNWSAFLIQTLQGMRLIKAYGLEQIEVSFASDISQKIRKTIIKSARFKAFVHPIMETLIGIATAAVIFIGGMYVISGQQSAGTLLSFIGALLLAYRPIKNLAELNSNIQESLVSARRLYDLLDIKPAIVDAPNAKDLEESEGELAFDNVSFSYPNGNTALRHVSFKIERGSKVAIVGTSGAGKSSLINLIPRFYDCSQGRILIDGVDISELKLSSLRKQIALVSQDNILFNSSIRDNIAYGRPSCGFGEIQKVADMAAATDFIQALPQGFDTVVGENGATLSGGQRQRIAIARALIKDAPILLLDEATSSLDSESERQVQSAISNLMQGRTTLVVAHRLSTILDSDRILVIDKGKIVESGSHNDLMKLKGIYAGLYSAQTFYS